MIAPLMAPIETPEIQSGSRPASCKGLVDARLVGAQRAAALQDERDPAATLGPRNPAGRLTLERLERLIHQRAPVSADRMAGGT